MPPPQQAPRGVRIFVAALLVAMTLTAAFAWEPWPLTSFRLFSTVRSAEQVGWVATTVDRAGQEADYPLGALGSGFRGFAFTMPEFVAAGRSRRDELCRIWVKAAPDLVDREAEQVRIYLNRRDLSERVGDRSARPERELRYVCSAEGARTVTGARGTERAPR